ncbi:Alcohol dehydrogenase GroES-like domain [Geosmithia morbida]|uniref:Alcohol dehydrogenase GroES-like domain n=1 Tax=Geosmithia morbida TaxID=1094350 RepID=A0A9P4YUD4_9HYPO|nr:Alcohol dehydrogenase GroES-like domain [Geosmithia morbida]KAF4122230.1 Alcohol dehydrogenase GroES-like domain [Geosmithia morbida]
MENVIKVTRACVVSLDSMFPGSYPGRYCVSPTPKGMYNNNKTYNRQYLCDLIIKGRAKPSFMVFHEVSMDKVEVAYHNFDKRINGWIYQGSNSSQWWILKRNYIPDCRYALYY